MPNLASWRRFAMRGAGALRHWLRREKAWRLRDRWLQQGDGEDHVRRVLGAPALFVLSPGRSGTELLSRIFRAAGGCDVHHAPRPELAYSAREAHRQGVGDEALEAAVLAARWEMLETAVMRQRLYVETNNRLSAYAPGIARLLPAARFLILVRHPAAFVRSAVRRGYYDAADHLHWFPRDTPVASFRQRPPVARAAWLWAETYRQIRAFEQGLGAGRCRTVKSEQLFLDPEAASSILAWVGAPALPRRRLQGLLARPVNVQRGGSFPAYEEWKPAEREQLAVEAGELALHYGYTLTVPSDVPSAGTSAGTPESAPGEPTRRSSEKSSEPSSEGVAG
ncbi:MAG: sulfotransferase [Acidobacteriota bacterium]